MVIKVKKNTSMDERAKAIVRHYIINRRHASASFKEDDFEVFIVWKVKALQNWKWLISTDLLDAMYYEVTYNGDKREFYLDAYEKYENDLYYIHED